jgi:hypothetical protein
MTWKTIILRVIYVEIMKNGVNMLRKFLIVTVGLLAIASWMLLYTITIKYWLGL